VTVFVAWRSGVKTREFLQLSERFATINEVRGKIQTFGQRLDFARDEQGGGTVQEDSIPFNPTLAARENFGKNPGILFAVTAA
jgi:hypothetical protein